MALEATVAEHGEPPSAGGGPAIIPAIVPAPLPLPETPLLLEPELPPLEPELPLVEDPPPPLPLEPPVVASSPNPPLLPDVPGPTFVWSPVVSGFDPHAAVTATAPAAIHNTCFVSDMNEPPAAWGTARRRHFMDVAGPAGRRSKVKPGRNRGHDPGQIAYGWKLENVEMHEPIRRVVVNTRTPHVRPARSSWIPSSSD